MHATFFIEPHPYSATHIVHGQINNLGGPRLTVADSGLLITSFLCRRKFHLYQEAICRCEAAMFFSSRPNGHVPAPKAKVVSEILCFLAVEEDFLICCRVPFVFFLGPYCTCSLFQTPLPKLYRRGFQ